MNSWRKSRTIRASVIRDILRGQLASKPDPHGLRMRGVRILGRLDLENISTQVWIELYECLFSQGINARDANLAGLILTGSRLQHRSLPPLDAARLSTTLLNLSSATIVGHNASGALNLQRANLGLLDCNSTYIYNDLGPALFATNLHVEHDLFLRDAKAEGAGDRGTIRLLGSHLGAVRCSRSSIHNESGPALLGSHMRVDQELYLDGVDAIGAGHQSAIIDLGNTQIGGRLVFSPAGLMHRSNPQALINADGMVYSGLPQGISGAEWLRLLRRGTLEYAPQPYQHLAAAHRAAGHDSQARRILMAQRHDQLQRRAIGSGSERAWVRLTGLTLGHGYQPWRALLGLLMVIIVSVTLAIVLGAHGGLIQVRNPSPIATLECTLVQRIGVGLDVGTPLITTGARASCEPSTVSIGQVFTAISWVLRLLAWALATLFIAGFTSAVRKT